MDAKKELIAAAELFERFAVSANISADEHDEESGAEFDGHDLAAMRCRVKEKTYTDVAKYLRARANNLEHQATPFHMTESKDD